MHGPQRVRAATPVSNANTFRKNPMPDSKKKPDAAKVALLRSLPVEIKASITGEEAELFMFGDEIPESLYEKIKDFLVASDE